MRVTLASGESFTLRQARVTREALSGVVSGERRTILLAEVAALEFEQVSAGKTLGLGAVLVAVIAVIVESLGEASAMDNMSGP